MVLDALDGNDIEGAKMIMRLHMRRVNDKIEIALFSDTLRTNKIDDEYSWVKIRALI